MKDKGTKRMTFAELPIGGRFEYPYVRRWKNWAGSFCENAIGIFEKEDDKWAYEVGDYTYLEFNGNEQIKRQKDDSTERE